MGESTRGGNSSVIDLIQCMNLCKCYNVPIPSMTIKKKRNANKNSTEIPPHPSLNGYEENKQHQMLVRMWGD
jgi:hypothetical protein